MSNAAAEAAAAYFKADLEAEKILAQLRQGELPENLSCDNGIYAWSCPVSARQRLDVEVRLEGDEYEILRWQLVSSTAWQADDDLKVWRGEKLG